MQGARPQGGSLPGNVLEVQTPGRPWTCGGGISGVTLAIQVLRNPRGASRGRLQGATSRFGAMLAPGKHLTLALVVVITITDIV